MKMVLPPFSKGNITFKMLLARDLPLTLTWRNNPEVRKWFKNSEKIKPQDHLEWFNSYSKKTDDYVFLAEVNNKTVGQLAVYNININTKSAEVGRFIASPAIKGTGIMKRVMHEFIHSIFMEFSLNELQLYVYDNNEVAINIYKDIGFEIVNNDRGLIFMRLLRFAE